MKRIFTLLLAFALVFTLTSASFAAGIADAKIKVNLTCDNKNLVTVETGDEIIVKYSVENMSANTGFMVSQIANEIFYDPDDFNLTESTITDHLGGQTTEVMEGSGGKRVIYFNKWEQPAKEYSAKQLVGSFKLEVTAPEGTVSVISSDAINMGVCYGADTYDMEKADLTVVVGNVELFDVIYKDGSTPLSTTKVAAGNITVGAAPTSTPSGYKFDGWQIGTTLYQPNDTYTVNANTVFTAKWSKITTNNNNNGGGGGGGGGGGAAKKTYKLSFETNEGSSIAENSVVNLTNYKPIRSGYTFAGWYLDAKLSQPATALTMTKDTTVYAAWTRGGAGSNVNKYILSFEENGGSDIADTPKVKGTTVDLSKYITEKSGYSFDGWHTDKDFKNKVTTVKMDSDITLYAKWVKGDNGYKPNPNYKPDIFTSEHIAYIVGREGGYIDPNANLTRAEAATMFFRLIDAPVLAEGKTTDNAFNDVNEGDWFNTAVSTLANLEVLNGRTANTFEPNATITRAEFMTIVARLSEAQHSGKDMFLDISGHWAKDYINIAASINWANGDNGMFRPDDNVTRAEAMTIINRANSRLPENVSDLLDGMTTFVDNADTNAWYYLNIQEATNSHNYGRKSDGVHEKWTGLNANPNWAELEG